MAILIWKIFSKTGMESVTVHTFSQNPLAAFEEIAKIQNFQQLKINTNIKEKPENHIRIVCMSDTHSENENFTFQIPEGDIFIHAGDFTRWGQETELIKFNEWMKALPHQYKIVIAGNHELSLDPNCIVITDIGQKRCSTEYAKAILKDCFYLEDSSVTLYGLKFYGSPWQPEYRGLAFNLPRGDKLLSKWNEIPTDTDILITHGPPLGHGDRTDSNGRAGCVELLSTIQKRVKPKYHIFGHIHEAYGMSTDGTTIFINASTCNKFYVPINSPIVFDIEIKE